MATYILTYDIKEGNDSTAIVSKLKEAKWAYHLQKSVWLIELNNTANEIYNYFLPHIKEKEDLLFVVKNYGTAEWNRATSKETADFINAKQSNFY